MPAIAYEQDKTARYSARQMAWNSDVSRNEPPPITPEDQATKDECNRSLLTFLLTVYPEAFPLKMSDSHLRLIDEIQDRIENGGLKAIVMPRGSGKTSILLRAAQWAIFTGKRKFVCIVAADEDTAISNLETVKREINHNPQIERYYGHETWCIRQLGNEPRRAATQHYQGTQTGVVYGRKEINFGSIPGSPTNNAMISTAGITGKIRGQHFVSPSGEIIRPDFVLIDDPQTKQSAGSPSQCRKRHETMMGDVLGLAGPGVRISGFCTCTVIYQNDLADRLLDHTQSPDWNGDRIPMIVKWPEWMEGWDQYNAIRVKEVSQGTSRKESTAFVKENFDKLHQGARVYWDERKDKSDLSALHHAMDLYYRDTGVFSSEYQNCPLDHGGEAPYDINIDTLMRRTVGIPRGTAPREVDKITAFIDTQRELLYYTIVAWTQTGRGYILDYGACPDQKRHHWTKVSAPYTLQQVYGDDFETYLYGGLRWLTTAILENEYRIEDGSTAMVDRLAIDARWGESTEIIRQFVRESRHRSRIHPSMGMYVGANSKKWQQIKSDKEKRRDRRGVHAKLITPKGGGRRELLYDTNYWKSFAADRLLCNIGSPKALVLFDAQPHIHRMFAEHCAHEEPVRVIGKTNNEVVEWKQKTSGSPENDFWDCLVGNCALASTIGVQTHHNNHQKGASMSKAIERVLKQKSRDQFFRSR